VLLSVDAGGEAAPPQSTSRFLRRRVKEPVPSSPQTLEPELDFVPVTKMSLPIAGFGNVTREDTAKLTDCLRDAAAAWPCPTVHLAGGGALEFADDRSVWARLDGDVEGLLAVARGVVESVASRGFFVDRRTFRPWLAVATITDTTTACHLESVVAALDAFRGAPWTVEWVSITKPSFDLGPGGSMEAHRIPLAAP
jgi:hypothetical protein